MCYQNRPPPKKKNTPETIFLSNRFNLFFNKSNASNITKMKKEMIENSIGISFKVHLGVGGRVGQFMHA